MSWGDHWTPGGRRPTAPVSPSMCHTDSASLQCATCRPCSHPQGCTADQAAVRPGSPSRVHCAALTLHLPPLPAAAPRAAQLTKLLSGLGPSFVKIGQALSARPDLLPQPYLEALSTLQDRLPSFPNEIAFAVIEEELGRPVEEVYMELSEVPVAAASLGQVGAGAG
jgi:hypothetical protein